MEKLRPSRKNQQKTSPIYRFQRVFLSDPFTVSTLSKAQDQRSPRKGVAGAFDSTFCLQTYKAFNYCYQYCVTAL